MDGRHRTFCGRDDCELRVWSDVTGGVHTLNACLLCVINPQKIALGIQPATECFMKVSRELGAEAEE